MQIGVEEVLESARITSTVERIGCARKSDLQRAPGENFWRPLRELLGTRRLRCAECNGVTYREGKLRKRMVVNSSGKEQISSNICPRVSMRIGEATLP